MVKGKIKLDDVVIKEGNYMVPNNWVWVKIGVVIELAYGKSLPSKIRIPGNFDVYGANGIVGNHVEYLVEGPKIIVGRKGSIGAINWAEGNIWPIDTTYYVISKGINYKYIYYYLKNMNLVELNKATAIPGLNRNDVYDKLIPIPPLKEQTRIVSKIEGFFEKLDRVDELVQIGEQIELIKKSILAKAFRGQLGTNCEEDESATELLKEILNK